MPVKTEFAHQRPAKLPVEHWENVKSKCSETSTFQNCEIMMQQKYSVLQ